jgi:hypothetical protein
LEKDTVRGSCLCGQVEYEYRGDARVFQYCHCSRCRKFTGSAHAANIILSPENFRWLNGADLVRHYRLPGARHFATAFCSICGSSLPWENQSGTAVIVPAGTLDTDPAIRPVQNIQFASRAGWYLDATDLPKYDTYPGK